ncbi:putative histidine kinase HHK1p [Xylaria sp. CBS 124048]|nr:putative histidine kinase HHK1p [Xylaria sp. CBS 124048]
MDGCASLLDKQYDPPPRIFERLRQLAGYSWSESNRPYHSTYDNWQFFGTRFVPQDSNATNTPIQPLHNSLSNFAKLSSNCNLSIFDHQFSPGVSISGANISGDHSEGISPSQVTFSAGPASDANSIFDEQPVVARISYHVLREERAFHVAKNLIATADPTGACNVKPVELVRLSPQPGDRGPIIAAIYECLGPNHLPQAIDLGPAFFYGRTVEDHVEAYRCQDFRLDPPISLMYFLDFAIGATQCIELLHHRHGMVHGEIRADAFHYNIQTGQVKLVSFGSGVRSFEHGLTSTGWSTLSKELGAKNKLLYISPEQTGRMPVEPDTRTDIYSLGVLFWMLLTQRPVFTGATPLDIVQCVLGRQIQIVSTIRDDIPEAIGHIIQKCTSKRIPDRYNSISGLRYDLQSVQKLLEIGDQEALRNWTIASKDVSSYFMLPTVMVGRDKEKAQVVTVIERAAESRVVSKGHGASSYAEPGRTGDLLEKIDSPSESELSIEGGNILSTSAVPTFSSGGRHPLHEIQQPPNWAGSQATSDDTFSSKSAKISSSIHRLSKAHDRLHSVLADSKGRIENASDQPVSSQQASLRPASINRTTSDVFNMSSSSNSGSSKYRRRGCCEIVTIEGAGGLGKSLLVQQVLVEARGRGYCATAKFDAAKRTAFAPLLTLVSSLFRQVWGERNTDTVLHIALRDYVHPIWPSLHQILGLPEFLFGPVGSDVAKSLSSVQNSSSAHSSLLPPRRRGSSASSPTSSQSRSPYAPYVPHMPSQSLHDYVRIGASTKTVRFMNSFLEILRIFAAHHFICLCLDDLQFADEESLELITQVIATRLNMVFIITYRPEEMAQEKVDKILHPVETEGISKTSSSRVTRVVLSPLTEDEIIRYVSYTLGRPREDVAPLALIVQSKTAGNPFYIREMLNACYRQKCIWYDYRENCWLYDLDRIFEQSKGEHGYDVMDNSYITRRLNALPQASREILTWAALLGGSFSFELICELMSAGIDNNEDGSLVGVGDARESTEFSKHEAIAGLQAAIDACIIVQEDRDDRFRFAHDRYIQAAVSTKGCDVQRMHFIIAETLLVRSSSGTQAKDDTASHICESVELIKRRVQYRYDFRQCLTDCAAMAIENGAKPTAVKYYRCALSLLQPDPWTAGEEDVRYDETLQLHLRAAECYIYMGNHQAAQELTVVVLKYARTADDKAAASLLNARIQFQSGHAVSALATLKQSLYLLDVKFDPQPTYEKCDSAFKEISKKIAAMGPAEVISPSREDKPQKMASGVILGDAVEAAWWSDALEFYNLSLALVKMHLEEGPMPQSSMAFLYLAMIVVSRFNMLDLALELGGRCSELLDIYRDPSSVARGYMAYLTFIGHINIPLYISVGLSDRSLDYIASAGDRSSVIFSFGLSVQMKLFASHNIVELESTCQYCCEEVPGWQQDTRGGTLLISVRQVCRALQGKTNITESKSVMSDDQHDSLAYKSWLDSHTENGGRSVLFYETIEIIPLYLYGHYEEACELGRRCMDKIDLIWSSRNTRVVLVFYGLALATIVLEKSKHPRTISTDMQEEVENTTIRLKGFSQKVKDWQSVSNVNYLSWSMYLDAQVAELSGDHGTAIHLYEEGLDHAAENGYTFEEALGNYLMAGFFIRQMARRSATAFLKEAISLWRQWGALGIANAIEDNHLLILHRPTPNPRTAEVAVQTDFAGDSASVTYAENGENLHKAEIPPSEEPDETRMAAWRGSTAQEGPGVGLPALDMIDLHAILVSSQVISSVLRIHVLLKTMCDVILQTCGSCVTQAAIVVQDEGSKSNDSWCIAASGNPENGATAHIPALPLIDSSLVAENVILYCTRFREEVFISDILTDERFGNVAVSWIQKKQMSKAVVAIPICHGSKPLLGVLYLEGEPGSFTDRTITVLQLLVNQIGISYSNALAMKELEKAFQQNDAMIEMQKRALAQAKEAESKAKNAEFEAKRNVKIAEEAAKAKNIFLANVSHELRTPLNGVIGNSELLRDSGLTKEQLEMAESIRVSADLLLTVINDILDFSKMEADKMKLYIIAFNPEEMVREVVRAVSYSNREKTSKKNVKIIEDINLPNMLVFGDPIRLHQVLGNLIGNSLKFTEDGSITIGAKVDSDWRMKVKLTFWVQDTGIGIPPKQLEKLFQPFSQGDATTARKYGGSGLGLSICKSLIETMMKGHIKLESQENVGTTVSFSVIFDKARPEVSAGDIQHAQPSLQVADRQRTNPEAAAGQRPPAPYMSLTMMSKNDLRICIAEDNLINQRIAIQYVRKLGYSQVDAYDNGLMAVEGLRKKAYEGKPYHIILMDVQMPVLDGYEATKLLRQDPSEEVRSILVIAMTASAIQGDREKCLAAGMNDYLAKPVKVDLLRRKLETYTTRQLLSPPSPAAKHMRDPVLSVSVND